MTGPAPETLDLYGTYQSFLEEKRLWDKDSGRMCAHNVISFHKDEKITLEEALEFGKEFAEKWFEGFQTLLAVHMDREHIHIHLITNTVSFYDGHKLHTTNWELEEMKQLTNQMCREKGLTVAEKGKDFYGNDLKRGTVSSWSKDEYNLLKNDAKDSFLANCAIAFMEVMTDCKSKLEFILKMKDRGWKVTWKDSRKNITFENEQGQKVRDKKLSALFNLDVSKEAILDECDRQAARAGQDEIDPEFEQYYREVEAALGQGTGENSRLQEENQGLRKEKSQLKSDYEKIKQESMQQKQKIKQKDTRIKEQEGVIDKLKKPFGKWL